MLQLRHLHGDVPARGQRRHLPAPDHPLRAGGPQGPAALQQGAVDLLPLRPVLRLAARPRPTPASSWPPPAATRSRATTPRGSRAPSTRGRSSARCSRSCVAAFFAVFMYASHGTQDGESLALFEFIPDALIHWTGIAVMVALALSGVVGVARWPDASRRARASRCGRCSAAAPPLGATARAAVVVARHRVARPAPLPRGLQGRRPRGALLPPSLVDPRTDDLGLPRAVRRDPDRLGPRAPRDQGDRDADPHLVPLPAARNHRAASRSCTA